MVGIIISFFYQDKILSLLDGIEQKIIWIYHQIFICHIITLSRSLGQDPDTPTFMEVLLGIEDCPCEAYRRATE